MNLKDRSSALILLAVIVVASGCAQGGDETSVEISQTSGVNIDSFSITPSEVYGSNPTTVELQLKNNGGQEARDVQAKLYNIAFEGPRTWSIQSGSQTLDYNNLRPANPETETPARQVSQVWTLEAPDVDTDRRIPYTINSRIFYKYNTEGVTDITVMSGQEFRNSDEGRERPQLDNSGGPIQMEVRTRSPVVFYEDSEGAEQSFCVIVSNEGEGTPFMSSANYDSASDQQNERKVTVSVEASGNQVSFKETEKTVNIIGKEGQTCFTMTADAISGSEIQQTVPITLEADYGYYLDTSASLTVRGRNN